MPSFSERVAQFMNGERTTSGKKKDTALPRLTAIKESEAAAVNNKLERSRLNNSKRSSWKPSRWFGKKDESTAMPTIDLPKLKGRSDTSNGGVYRSEQAALSSFLLADRNRYEQVEVDKNKRPFSMNDMAAQYLVGVVDSHELPVHEQVADERIGKYTSRQSSRIADTVMNGNDHLSPEVRVHELSASPAFSWVRTPKSDVCPEPVELPTHRHSPDPLPHRASNASLYDGSTWGPVSPRLVRSQIFSSEVQTALQDKLVNNTRNRLSLPESLRYGASNIKLPDQTRNMFDNEFAMTLSPTESSDNPFDDRYAAANTTPSVTRVNSPAAPIYPASLTQGGQQRSLPYVYTMLGDHEGLPERANMEIMSKTELVGQPFALPYRSYSPMFGASSTRPGSVRHRRGMKGRLIVDVSEKEAVMVKSMENGEYFRYPLHSGECSAAQVGSMV